MEKEYQSIRESQLRSKDMTHTQYIINLKIHRRTLSEEELNLLREGLHKQLKLVEKEYNYMSHKTIIDTLVEKRKKENLEKRIHNLEKDLQKLDKKIVKVDLTK